MAETNPPAAPKTRRWGKALLFVSLALNLLVAGAVVGAMLGGPRDRAPVLRDIGFGPFVQALPRSDRAALSQALHREAGAFRRNRAALRGRFEALLTALRADPYDHAEVARLIDEGQDRILERQRLGRALLLERIEAMDDARRRDYADALDEALRRRRDHPHRGD